MSNSPVTFYDQDLNSIDYYEVDAAARKLRAEFMRDAAISAKTYLQGLFAAKPVAQHS